VIRVRMSEHEYDRSLFEPAATKEREESPGGSLRKPGVDDENAVATLDDDLAETTRTV